MRFEASFRPVMRYARRCSDLTRCSAIGRLPQRASLATVGSEAWGTTSPRSKDRPWEREPTRRLPASRRSGAIRPGQVNSGEVLIKAVNRNKPKMLIGLDQNGTWPGPGVAMSPVADDAPPAERHDLSVGRQCEIAHPSLYLRIRALAPEFRSRG